MIMTTMERSKFNKQYNYRLVLSSDNIDLKHCGNCTHFSVTKRINKIDECLLMVGCGIPFDEIKVNSRRGLCNLHQRIKQ